jgi:hypothetical protein
MTDKTSPTSDDLLTRKWALVALACATPVFVLVVYFADIGRARAAAGSVATMVLAIRACWDLNKNVWFWITIAIAAGCHILLILFVPWTSKSYPGYALLPIGILDFALIYGALKLVDKIAKTRAS